MLMSDWATGSRPLCLSPHSVFLGGVFVILQHSDSVSAAKPLDPPHCQVSEFLTHSREKRMKRGNTGILISVANIRLVSSHLVRLVDEVGDVCVSHSGNICLTAAGVRRNRRRGRHAGWVGRLFTSHLVQKTGKHRAEGHTLPAYVLCMQKGLNGLLCDPTSCFMLRIFVSSFKLRV